MLSSGRLSMKFGLNRLQSIFSETAEFKGSRTLICLCQSERSMSELLRIFYSVTNKIYSSMPFITSFKKNFRSSIQFTNLHFFTVRSCGKKCELAEFIYITDNFKYNVHKRSPECKCRLCGFQIVSFLLSLWSSDGFY